MLLPEFCFCRTTHDPGLPTLKKHFRFLVNRASHQPFATTKTAPSKRQRISSGMNGARSWSQSDDIFSCCSFWANCTGPRSQTTRDRLRHEPAQNPVGAHPEMRCQIQPTSVKNRSRQALGRMAVARPAPDCIDNGVAQAWRTMRALHAESSTRYERSRTRPFFLMEILWMTIVREHVRGHKRYPDRVWSRIAKAREGSSQAKCLGQCAC